MCEQSSFQRRFGEESIQLSTLFATNFLVYPDDQWTGIVKDIRGEGKDIDRDEYPNGYALYAFDLSPDLTDSESFSLARQETVCVEMTFGEALPSTVTIVSYAEFENIIELDRNRNVVFDFNN